MNVNTETQSNTLFSEIIKWIIVIVLLIIAFVGNCLFQDVVIFPLRMLAIIILVIIASSVALLTTKGKAMIMFIRETRIEVHKVIWPTYQETLHTTLTVAVVTTVMSLILWGLDSILVRLISFLTNLRFF